MNRTPPRPGRPNTLTPDTALEIRPLRPDDIEALSRLLTEGFHSPPDAPFAAPDVLRWKYLEPDGGDGAPRSLVACVAGRIVGHVGTTRTAFRGPALPPGGVSALHMIDWLGTRGQRVGPGLGVSLARRVHLTTEAQYVLVANDLARRVTGSVGYAPVADVPIFQKVLRAGYRWRLPGSGPAGRLAHVARDAARMLLAPGRRPRRRFALCRVERFGDEVAPLLDHYRSRAILTSRDPERLNYALRYPRPGMSGWLIRDGGRLVGLGLLNVVEHGPTRTGKLVECLLGEDDPDAWHAAVSALTGELAAQGADVAVAYGSTPWMAEALRRSGFRATHRVGFTLRDPAGLIPRDATFHLSPFEADDAYF